MPKTVPSLPGIEPGNLPFSKVIEANGFVFLAGQIGDAPGSNGPVPGGIEAETRAMLENVGRLLRAVGLDFRDVVKATVYLTDIAEFLPHEHDLPRVLPGRPANPGDRRRRRPGGRRPCRDRGDRDALRFAAEEEGRTRRRPPRLAGAGRRWHQLATGNAIRCRRSAHQSRPGGRGS